MTVPNPNMYNNVDPTTVRAISWGALIAGQWTRNYMARPCASGLLAVGRRWPEWPLGKPPTWMEFVSASEISGADRRWLVAHVLLRDRRRLVAWAVDCAEAVIHLTGASEISARTDVIDPLRAWTAGDDSIELRVVHSRAWTIYGIYCTAAGAAAAAATATATATVASAAVYAATSAAAEAAEAAAARAAARAARAADAMLLLALPHLAALESGPSARP